MVNTAKIKERMKQLGIRQSDVASCLGIQQATANQKINNVRCLSLAEADKMQRLLGITAEEFASYFFA